MSGNKPYICWAQVKVELEDFKALHDSLVHHFGLPSGTGQRCYCLDRTIHTTIDILQLFGDASFGVIGTSSFKDPEYKVEIV